jgi:hypothetical protein
MVTDQDNNSYQYTQNKKVYLNTGQQMLVSKKEGYPTELHTFLP